MSARICMLVYTGFGSDVGVSPMYFIRSGFQSDVGRGLRKVYMYVPNYDSMSGGARGRNACLVILVVFMILVSAW